MSVAGETSVIQSLKIQVDNDMVDKANVQSGAESMDDDYEEGEASSGDEDEVEVNVIVGTDKDSNYNDTNILNEDTSSYAKDHLSKYKDYYKPPPVRGLLNSGFLRSNKFKDRRIGSPNKSSEKEDFELDMVLGVDRLKRTSTVLEERAKRFGIDIIENEVISESQMKELFKSLDITEDDFHRGGFRAEAIHVRGIENLSSSEIFTYFKEYTPHSIEWLNKSSCNVIWNNEHQVIKAFLGLSCPIKSSKSSKTSTKLKSKKLNKNKENSKSSKEKTSEEKSSKKAKKQSTKKTTQGSEDSSSSSSSSSSSESESDSEDDDSSSDSSSSSSSSSSGSSGSSSDSSDSSSSSSDSEDEDNESSKKNKGKKKEVSKSSEEPNLPKENNSENGSKNIYNNNSNRSNSVSTNNNSSNNNNNNNNNNDKAEECMEVDEISHTKSVEEMEDCVSAEYVGVPIPPGRWRLGVPCPNTKAILMRFAHCKDKKLPGLGKPVELFTEFVIKKMKRESPNKMDSDRRFRKAQKRRRPLEDSLSEGTSPFLPMLPPGRGPIEWSGNNTSLPPPDNGRFYKDLDDPVEQNRNPWGFLAQNWGRKETQDNLDYQEMLREYVTGQKRKREKSDSEGEETSFRPFGPPRELFRRTDRYTKRPKSGSRRRVDVPKNSDDEEDDVVAWNSKIKLPIMRMYADAEEMKNKKRQSKDSKRIRERLSPGRNTWRENRRHVPGSIDLRTKLLEKKKLLA